jgi:hypothetical protein
MDLMAPKMDLLLERVQSATGVALPVTKAVYPYCLSIAIGLEVVGGFLFLFDKRRGALMLVSAMQRRGGRGGGGKQQRPCVALLPALVYPLSAPYNTWLSRP